MIKKLTFILLAISFVIFSAGTSQAFAMQAAERGTEINKAAPKIISAVKVIVIDPGHGGKDTGAVGPRGIKEKDVTLGVALELKRLLDKHSGFEVILTRDDDRGIELDKRAETVARAGADLFISIHVNSSEHKEVKGIETFFLSFEASNNEARLLAARENNLPAIEAAPEGSTASRGDNNPLNNQSLQALNDILTDMVQSESHHESARLAELIHKNLIKATGARNRGVRQAPFRVLTGTAVPAVLLELGFLSNKAEARRLTKPKTQQAIAQAITTAIVEFDDSLTKETKEDNIITLKLHREQLRLSTEKKLKKR